MHYAVLQWAHSIDSQHHAYALGPACRLYVRDKNIQKSQVKENNHHPIWNEEFKFLVHEPQYQARPVSCRQSVVPAEAGRRTLLACRGLLHSLLACMSVPIALQVRPPHTADSCQHCHASSQHVLYGCQHQACMCTQARSSILFGYDWLAGQDQPHQPAGRRL